MRLPSNGISGSLGARLVAAVLAPALVFFAAQALLAWFAARATLEDEVGARLCDAAATAAALLPAGLIARFEPGNPRTHANLQGRLDAVRARVGARRVFLATLDGRSLVDTAPDAPAPGEPDRDLAQDRVELARVGAGEAAASVLYEGLDGERYMRGYAPVLDQGRVVAAVGVEGSARNYAGLDALGRYVAAVGGVGLAALVLVALLFARAVTAPLHRLVAAARRIGAGELDPQIARERAGGTELGLLAATMDEMRAALLRRERELQMMLGGIAHEVRNPLGGMALFVGLLREDLADRPAERALLDRVEGELGNLTRIVEEFLAYARQAPVERAPVPVGPLLAELRELVPVPLDDETPAGLVLHADPAQLRRVLLNLARNAAQAGAGGVRVRGGPGWLEVADDGPGVPVDQADKVFEAFYTTREKGTGLGLALCRRIAESHGGRLRLANPGEPGAVFRLELPDPPPDGVSAAGGMW